MNVLLYDGSFEGLLTALYIGLKKNLPNLRIQVNDVYRQDLFSQVEMVDTDSWVSRRFGELIRRELSSQALRHIYHVYLSERDDAATLLLPFLMKGFVIGPGVNGLMADPVVQPVLSLSRQVSRETHRLQGLIRFQELENGLLYSRFEPDFHQTPLLAFHFAGRLPSNPWMLHDLKRELAACWDTRQWTLHDLPAVEMPDLPIKETDFQQLWKTYFSHIAVRQRNNPRVQRSFMPKKYWKHLIEKPGG